MDFECHDDCNVVSKKTAAKEHVIIYYYGCCVWTMSIVVLYQNNYINVLFRRRIQFKLLLLVYRCTHQLAPAYLTDLVALTRIC